MANIRGKSWGTLLRVMGRSDALRTRRFRRCSACTPFVRYSLSLSIIYDIIRSRGRNFRAISISVMLFNSVRSAGVSFYQIA